MTAEQRPQRVVAVDWSGAATASGRGIWLADVDAGSLELRDLRGGWTRDAVAPHLADLAAAQPQLAVGLDFAFSLPAWFLQERGYATAAQLWDDVETCERWVRECPAPFWGRGAQPTRPVSLDPGQRLRRTAKEVFETYRVRPKSVFQLGGAGTVGTGSLRGMRALSRLRAHGFAVWPFDSPRLPVVVEIYPRLMTDGTRLSDAASRRAFLDRQRWPERMESRVVASNDRNAFDAAVSALAMAGHAGELGALPPARDRTDQLEGRIWAPHPAGS